MYDHQGKTHKQEEYSCPMVALTLRDMLKSHAGEMLAAREENIRPVTLAGPG